MEPGETKSEFEVNPDYVYDKHEKNLVDEVGKIDIPDKRSFYMVLSTSSINILTSRRNQITKTKDVIDIRGLASIETKLNNIGETE